jgi:hypothetical protein
VTYLSGLFILIGGEIHADTKHAAQDGQDPGKNQLPHPSCLE